VTEQNPARAELTAFKGMRVDESVALVPSPYTVFGHHPTIEPAPELGEFDRRTSGAQHD
jgi:hypothetical protein